MRSRLVLTAVLAASILGLAGCTSADDPQANAPDSSPSSSPMDASTAPNASPQASDDPLGGYGSTPEEAQEQLDAAMAALRESPSVEIKARRTLGQEFIAEGRPASRTLRAHWWPADHVWLGVSTVKVQKYVLTTEILVGDGRTLVRQSVKGDTYPTGWLDISDTDATVGWALDDVLTSIEASNAITRDDTTTIVGRVPTATVIKAFGLDDAALLESVQEELAAGTTLVRMEVIDGYLRTLSIDGDDIELPPDGIPETSLAVLGRCSLEMTFAPGDRKQVPRLPRPSKLDNPPSPDE